MRCCLSENHALAAGVADKSDATLTYSVDGVNFDEAMPGYVNAGSYEITVKATLAGYAEATAKATLTITPRPITIAANDDAKVYGEDDPAVFTADVEGILAGDAQSDVVTYTVTRDAGEDVGTYDVMADATIVSKNYELQSTTPALFAITPRPVTITASPASKLFGEEDPALDGVIQAATGDEGLIEGDDLAPVYTRTNAAVHAVGVYEDVLTATHNNNPNYTITVVKADFTITDTLAVTLADLTVPYDGETHALTAADVTLRDVDNADRVKLTYTYNGEDFDALPEFADVGAYPITVTASLQGYDDATYDATLTITPLHITIVAQGGTKVYGEADPAAFTADVEGILEADAEDVTVDYAVTREAGEDVGEYDLTVVESSVSSENYVIDDTTDAIFTITPRQITITVDDSSKRAGNADPAFTGSMTEGSLVEEGDLGTISYVRINDDEAVGSYSEVLSAEFTANANYEVMVVNGDFTITRRPGGTYTPDPDPDPDPDPIPYAPIIPNPPPPVIPPMYFDIVEDLLPTGPITLDISDEEVPNGPVREASDFVDIEEEETPYGPVQKTGELAADSLIFYAIGLAIIAGGLILLFARKRRERKDAE